MAGADPLDRPKIDRLRRESQVRTLARQMLYREYPRRATPQLVEQVVRRVMEDLEQQRPLVVQPLS